MTRRSQTPAAASSAITAFGFRTCYRRPTVQHHPDNIRCDCLRTELPVEAQAKSSGRLATDHESMARDGRAARVRESFGESFPRALKSWDRATRERLSAASKAGKLGAR